MAVLTYISSCVLSISILSPGPTSTPCQQDPCSGARTAYTGPLGGARYGWSTAVDGDRSVIGAPFAAIVGLRTGAVFVHERVGGSWFESGRFKSLDAGNNDEFGFSVALDGDRLVVGAPMHDPFNVVNAGAAYVFERTNGQWVEVAKLLPDVIQTSAAFGISVAVQGDTAVVGAHTRALVGFESGAVYVYERVAGTWGLSQVLSGAQHQWGDWLGRGVAIDGDWIVAGGPGIDGAIQNSGGAFVYRRTPQGWVESARLVPWDNGGLTWNLVAGWSVAIHGDRVFLPAAAANVAGTASGAMYVFRYEPGAWMPLTKLVAPDATTLTKFGNSLAARPGALLVGASSDPEGILGSGSAYLFRETADGYALERKLRAPTPQADSFFGMAVALHGSTALVGAYNEGPHSPGSGTPSTGAAYFFELADFASSLCFGASCPCANPDPVRGCRNSSGRGAGLVACGSASVGADDLVLRAERLPADQPALLFRAQNLLAGGQGLAFGDGLRCIGGQALRLGVGHADASGHLAFGPGLSAAGQWHAGQTLHAQAWYRDPLPSPCGNGFNATQALTLTFEP